MKIPWRRQQHEDIVESRAVPGEELFDRVAGIAFSKLEAGTTEDVYRVSLVSAESAAIRQLQTDSQLRTLWGQGDEARAARLLEVWGSTIAITLWQHESDQVQVCAHVALGMSALFSDSNPDEQMLELRAFQLQREFAQKRHVPGGFYLPGTDYWVLRLRCVRALGESVDFKRIPIPINSAAEFLEMNLIDPKYLGSFEDVFTLHQLHAVYAAAANAVFASNTEMMSIGHVRSTHFKALEEISKTKK